MGKKSKLNFVSHMKSVLRNSLLTGIPQIVFARNLWRRVTRTLVLLICIAGFIYQSLTFMQFYWEYKTLVDVKVTNPTYATVPAMTVCHNHGVRISRACNETETAIHGFDCRLLTNETISDNFCKCYKRYCFRGVLGDGYYDMSMSELAKIISLPWKIKRKWMGTHMDIFGAGCKEWRMDETNRGEGYCKRPLEAEIDMGCPNDSGFQEYCLMINTAVKHPHLKPKVVISDAQMMLWILHNDLDVPVAMETPRVYMSIQNSYQNVNPFYDGFMVEPWVTYFFHLKKTVKHLLPEPYETDCVDYMERWRARGGWGPLNLRECVEDCKKNLSLTRHGCVLFTIRSPGKELRCPVDYKTLEADSEECSKNCKAACYEETYVVDREMSSREKKLLPGCIDKKSYEFDEGSSPVYILMDGMETTTYSYSPQYHAIETFSYLGGYVGMWLGISLVAVFDFVDTLVVMIKYPVRKYLKTNKTKVRKINYGSRIY